MFNKALRGALQFCATAIILVLAACGGNQSNSNNNGNTGGSTPQIASMGVIVSDDPSEDWAMIGVKVLSISLTPQGGGTPVTVFTAPSPVPVLNLVQLDQIGDILGNATVPPGTYTSATLSLSANPGDVSLVASADPEAGFAGTAGAAIPSSQIQIVGAQGSAGSLTVPLKVNFSSPITVTAGQNSAVDLEFNLAHPAFIVAHVPAGGASILWAVNFNPAFRHHPIDDITRLVLRHLYGSVTSVASDNSSITITRDFPAVPVTNPETAISSSQSLTILADSVNGTIFYDLDAQTTTTIKDFSAEASSLPGKFVRIAARYQQDGTLVAVRVWASSSFQNVFVSPEGLVLHVDSSTDTLVVDNDQGLPVPITINANTQFFFRAPSTPASDAAPIGSGTGFLSNLVRGFKVHVSVVDPLSTPFVAQTVDIETAAFSGFISAANTTGFTDTRLFHTATDDYTKVLDYVSSNTPNGKDSSGNAITGFKWWNLTFPTQVDSGSNAISDFVAAVGGGVNFGGSTTPVEAFGSTNAVWNNSANPNNWSALFTILDPVPLPLATVAENWVTTGAGGTFGITVANGSATPVIVNASSVSGSATLFFQIDRTNGILTVSPQDITTTAGLNNISANLISPNLAKVFGVPQPDGSVKAYVIFYFTGTQPTE